MAEHVLDVVPGAGIAMTEGSGTDQGKLFISALNNGNVYYGSYNDNSYHGPETNSYFFLTYYDGSDGTVNYSIFVKTQEQIVTDSSSEDTNGYIVTYSPINSAVEYLLVGNGRVPKDAVLGDGTLLVNITSWSKEPKTSTTTNSQE